MTLCDTTVFLFLCKFSVIAVLKKVRKTRRKFFSGVWMTRLEGQAKTNIVVSVLICPSKRVTKAPREELALSLPIFSYKAYKHHKNTTNIIKVARLVCYKG